MKVVIDTNILFSYFNEHSFTKKLIENSLFELISPEFALLELEKYKEIICEKAKVSFEEFTKRKENLKKTVAFLNKERYKDFLDQSQQISPDPDDADFFALAFFANTFLWSNDKLLKNQDKIPVLSTKEIIQNFFE